MFSCVFVNGVGYFSLEAAQEICPYGIRKFNSVHKKPTARTNYNAIVPYFRTISAVFSPDPYKYLAISFMQISQLNLCVLLSRCCNSVISEILTYSSTNLKLRYINLCNEKIFITVSSCKIAKYSRQ